MVFKKVILILCLSSTTAYAKHELIKEFDEAKAIAKHLNESELNAPHKKNNKQMHQAEEPSIEKPSASEHIIPTVLVTPDAPPSPPKPDSHTDKSIKKRQHKSNTIKTPKDNTTNDITDSLQKNDQKKAGIPNIVKPPLTKDNSKALPKKNTTPPQNNTTSTPQTNLMPTPTTTP